VKESPVATKLPWRVALGASGALDADDLRPSINNPIPAHRGKGFVDGVFTGRHSVAA
jgi:hypothetical protein